MNRQLIRSMVRWAIFFITFLGFPLVFIEFFSLGTACWVDPFFWLQNVFIHITNPELIGYLDPARTYMAILLVVSLGGLIVLTFAFGRAFCAWVCPFGTILDFFGKFSDLFEVKRKELPEVLRDRYIKYGILVGFIASAAILGRYAFCDICPLGACWRATGPYAYSFPWLLLIPLFFLLTLIFVAVKYDPRTWCKYFCPLGAFIVLVDRFKYTRIQLPADSCIECHRCEKICPMNIRILNETRYKLVNDPKLKALLDELGEPDLLKTPKRFDKLPEEVQKLMTELNSDYKVPSAECIRCYQCVDECPVLQKAKEKK